MQTPHMRAEDENFLLQLNHIVANYRAIEGDLTAVEECLFKYSFDLNDKVKESTQIRQAMATLIIETRPIFNEVMMSLEECLKIYYYINNIRINSGASDKKQIVNGDFTRVGRFRIKYNSISKIFIIVEESGHVSNLRLNIMFTPKIVHLWESQIIILFRKVLNVSTRTN